MFVVYEVVNGVKWKEAEFATEGGAKRSVTCAMKRVAKRASARTWGKAGMKEYGYMSASAWANRTVPMKKVRSLMTGVEIEIPADTPYCCDPSTERYWSM